MPKRFTDAELKAMGQDMPTRGPRGGSCGSDAQPMYAPVSPEVDGIPLIPNMADVAFQIQEDLARLVSTLTGMKKQLTDAGWSEHGAEMIVIAALQNAK